MRTWSYFFVYFLCLAISSLSGIAKANDQLEESPYGNQEEIATIQKELVPIEAPTRVATLKEIEMEAIKASVERNKWNMTTTAEELGISRMTLYRKLEQYGLRGKE